jgi:hypothetical protein
MRLAFIILLLALGLLPAHGQNAQGRKYFGAWLAACEADGYCSAVSYVNPNPGDGRVADYWFRIGRHAQESYWELSFTPIKVEADWNQALTFSVDGETETLVGYDEIAPYGAINDLFLLGKKAQLVMDRLMPGTTLDVGFTDRNGETQGATFSLSGLTAALIWIDERQNRLGSERVAEAPPVGLQIAAPPPVLDLFTVTFLALHNGQAGCSETITPETYDQVRRIALDQYHTLYSVACERFAYNSITAYYVGTDSDLQPAIMPDSDAAGGTLGNTLYGGDWDEMSGILSSHYKGGNGNCGSEGKWQWSGDRFELIELRARETCDNTTEEWPIVAGGTTN